MPDPMHLVIESHYLETTEGLFFAVKGLVHPPDRIVGCLRYRPNPDGDRQKAGYNYSRLYHFAEQVQFLQDYYPQYLAFEWTVRATLQSVPRQFIRRIYDPRVRMQELSLQFNRDPLEDDALAFIDQLHKLSGVSKDSLGISGSLLIGLHTPKSDLDVTVHGKHNCLTLHQALKRLLAQDGSNTINRLDEQGMEALYAERSADTHMAYTNFFRSERDKVIQGQFHGRTYFIRFLKELEETGETYGSLCYSPEGKAEILATVTDDNDAIFTPCCYSLGEVRFLDGSPVEDLREIISYRGRFCEQARIGDMVQAYGTLERVQDRSGRTWHRLLLGNNVEDTMFLQR
jgi:predicted nucleotidyltransferase